MQELRGERERRADPETAERSGVQPLSRPVEADDLRRAADHVAAVTTLLAATRERAGHAAAGLGAAWGLGHALTLFALGLPIRLFDAYLPDAVYGYFSNGGGPCYVTSLRAMDEGGSDVKAAFVTVPAAVVTLHMVPGANSIVSLRSPLRSVSNRPTTTRSESVLIT